MKSEVILDNSGNSLPPIEKIKENSSLQKLNNSQKEEVSKVLRTNLFLPAFIEEEIYPAEPFEGSKDWKLGWVHYEWAELFHTSPRVRILAARDHLKCVEENSMITMSDGSRKKIKQIKKGDNILSLNENTLKIEKSTIEETKSKKSIIYEIIFKSGRKLKCSKDHKFLSFEGWKKLEKLKLREYVAVPREYDLTDPKDTIISKNAASFSGFMIGDRGCITSSCTFTNTEESNIKLFGLSASDIFWDKVKSIKLIGEAITYDLQVSNNTNFIANDIFVHNSFIACCWVLFRLKQLEGGEVYYISKSDELAKRRLKTIKTMIEKVPSLQYLKGDIWKETSIKTSQGTELYAQGYFSAIRGEHPKLLILDDPIDIQVVFSKEINDKVKIRWLSEILPLAETDTQIIVIGTVQREDDLYSILTPPEWKVRNYSAIISEEKKITLFPEKWNWEELEKRKAEMLKDPDKGERFWRKEYLNDPTAMRGSIFNGDWFKYSAAIPLNTVFYLGCDLSVAKQKSHTKLEEEKLLSGDYTAIVCLGVCPEGNYYIVDCIRGKWSLDERLNNVERMARIWDPDLIVMEDNAFQEDNVQLAIRRMRHHIKGETSTKDKIQRAHNSSVPFQNGKVFFHCKGFDENNYPILSPDMRMMVTELLNFPGSNDDFVDALDKAFIAARSGVGIGGMSKNKEQQMYENLLKARAKSIIDQRIF